ncbi:tail fiber domain-containing protein [Bartonella sp. CB178]|uniref:tail fiber domain-containing protein n=1 Tax=Bartonella sp. CB178 TaxID=3112255 RepID=UPI00300E4804
MRKKVTPQIQTKTQTNAPPIWAEDILKTASAQALDLFNKGVGGNVYQGERIAGLSDITKNAISGLKKAADQYNNPALMGVLNAPTQSATNLSNMAKGNLIGGNSKFDIALQNALNKTSDAINQSVAGAGRYGSGAHAGVLADELGALATNASAQQYNQDVRNMMNANQMIDNSWRDQINAANAFFQGQSNAQNNALKSGVIQDTARQNALDSQYQKWMEEDNKDWNKLERLLQAGKQAAGNYGTTSAQSVTESPVMNDSLNDVQRLLGLVGGILGLSDARAKENIVPVGKKNGYPLYTFNYKGCSQRYYGVIAQEILRLNPEAVHMDKKTKLLHVDYSKLGFKMKKVTVPKRKIFSFFPNFFNRLCSLKKTVT